MMVATRQLGIVMTGLIGLAVLVALQINMVRWQGTEKKLDDLMYLPDAEYLRMASLGHRELLADLLWIQSIQVMAERTVSEASGRWLYRALDIITTLDPTFVRAYEAGGLALTTLVVLPEESNRLMLKGVRHNPMEWKLPFYLGINSYFEFYDDAKAAEYIAAASKLPGAPSGLVSVAANLFAAAKSPQQGVDLLTAAYHSTSDDNTRKLIEQRLKILVTERDLVLLEAAVGRYHARTGNRPGRLDDLVTAGLIPRVPDEPSGGRYLYEPATGVVSSSELPERPKITARRRMR
jgi:hypothetical protein